MPPESICDGFPNCAGGDDEIGCDVNPGCAPDELPGCTGACFTASWFGDGTCDGFLNCAETGWDGGDCDASGSCTPGQFQCSDGDCIAIGWQCDGEADCEDGEDEIVCPEF